MSIEESITRLRNLAQKIPRSGCEWEERPLFKPPAISQDIAIFEQVLGYNLPFEFRLFLAQTNAIIGMSIHNGYYIGDVEQLTRSCIRGDYPLVIEGKDSVPVATDGGGNAFLLSLDGSVWRWEHESGQHKFVTHSFDLFIERVVDDWCAYISDNPNWHFLV